MAKQKFCPYRCLAKGGGPGGLVRDSDTSAGHQSAALVRLFRDLFSAGQD